MLRFSVSIGQPIRLNSDTVTVVSKASSHEFRIRHGAREYAISRYTDARLMIDGCVVVIGAMMRNGSVGADMVGICIDAPRAVKIERAG